MSNAFFDVPVAVNEPVLQYFPGSPEKNELKKVYNKMKTSEINVPMVIGGRRINTKDKRTMHPPHDKKHVLGTYSQGDKSHVDRAIAAALKAKPAWEDMPWQERASIFLRAAELLAGPYRARMNAATMLCQSKNAYQAEIDSVCELCDFFRFNVQYMIDIYAQQPESAPGIWNKLEYRALEGFVFAITPFNFTSIAANLAAAPALMGNTVVWKPAASQIYSAHVIMDLLQEAGLPDGVINLVFADGPVIGEVIFKHRDFAGLHFTGSTGVFKSLWGTIASNLDNYRTYPRIVGETGGKDFVVAHKSTDPKVLATALVRGSFEYQGQKCSAASRAYVPKSLWDKTWKFMKADIESMKMGSPEDFTNFINAVIDEKSYKNIKSYITGAKRSKDAKVLIGGECNDAKGYFVEPTVILAKKADYKTMCEEIFGPVLTVYVYKDADFEKILDVVDNTSEYALTGSIFSNDRSIVELASKKLRNAAGNFYINDKPTGAVVGQQPFGGARGSGTNDKAGSYMNLLRWVSPRTIKETFVPATNYRYPFLLES